MSLTKIWKDGDEGKILLENGYQQVPEIETENAEILNRVSHHLENEDQV